MPETVARNYDIKAVPQSQSGGYQSFGWVRSKQPVPEDIDIKSKEPLVLMKRKLAFGANPELRAYEENYDKLLKKKYRSKPLLGILSFILMLVFIVVAALSLYFGISAALSADPTPDGEAPQAEDAPANAAEEEGEEAPADTADTEKGGILGILDKVHDDYLSKVTGVFDGVAESLSSSLGSSVGKFISGDTILGIIALILGIIFLIIFAKVCGIKKKRAAKENKLEELRDSAEEVVLMMKSRDLSLMNKHQRKQYMWENIIANALIRANGTGDVEEDY